MKNQLALFACLAGLGLNAQPSFITGDEAVKTAARYQQRANQMKAVCLSAKSDYSSATGRLYYVSSAGNDANDGLSLQSPIATLSAVARLRLKRGDGVLFRRGDLFRGRINAAAGVTYSAYGEGSKPTICSSLKNYADTALWQKTSLSNVWRCADAIANAGVIIFDHKPQDVGVYDVKFARLRHSRKGVQSPAHLTQSRDFWCDLNEKKLYLYCPEGNPGAVYRQIEIGDCKHVVSVGGNGGVTIDNLHLTLSGCHGVGAGTVQNLEVRSCVFDWIGGSLLIPEGRKGGPCRFGNAVEVYGGCNGYRVHDCWMYQIYDTGITHQCHHANNSHIRQFNVEYARNLIEYCFWSIEYYNAFNKFGETRNVRVHDNFCRFGGYGWGCCGRAGGAPMFSIDDRPDVTENYVNEVNVLERCLGLLVNNFGRHASPPGFVFRRNVYIQPRGWNFAHIGDFKPALSKFDESAAQVVRDAFGEDDGTFVILPEEERILPR